MLSRPWVSTFTITRASIIQFLLGLPHATTADDIYEDVFIPKGSDTIVSEECLLTLLLLYMLGSTVVANIWLVYHLLSFQDHDLLFNRAMYHDEDAYPEPDVFKPERFFVNGALGEDKSIDSLAFGFGRYCDMAIFL